MTPFRDLVIECMSSKNWKVRAMAARCFPVVIDPEKVKGGVFGLCHGFKLHEQNEMHGKLMAIKRLGEFYSYRTLKDVVFGNYPPLL